MTVAMSIYVVVGIRSGVKRWSVKNRVIDVVLDFVEASKRFM